MFGFRNQQHRTIRLKKKGLGNRTMQELVLLMCCSETAEFGNRRSRSPFVTIWGFETNLGEQKFLPTIGNH